MVRSFFFMGGGCFIIYSQEDNRPAGGKLFKLIKQFV